MTNVEFYFDFIASFDIDSLSTTDKYNITSNRNIILRQEDLKKPDINILMIHFTISVAYGWCIFPRKQLNNIFQYPLQTKINVVS